MWGIFPLDVSWCNLLIRKPVFSYQYKFCTLLQNLSDCLSKIWKLIASRLSFVVGRQLCLLNSSFQKLATQLFVRKNPPLYSMNLKSPVTVAKITTAGSHLHTPFKHFETSFSNNPRLTGIPSICFSPSLEIYALCLPVPPEDCLEIGVFSEKSGLIRMMKTELRKLPYGFYPCIEMPSPEVLVVSNPELVLLSSKTGDVIFVPKKSDRAVDMRMSLSTGHLLVLTQSGHLSLYRVTGTLTLKMIRSWKIPFLKKNFMHLAPLSGERVLIAHGGDPGTIQVNIYPEMGDKSLMHVGYNNLDLFLSFLIPFFSSLSIMSTVRG
jgi:hypothetical protein